MRWPVAAVLTGALLVAGCGAGTGAGVPARISTTAAAPGRSPAAVRLAPVRARTLRWRLPAAVAREVVAGQRGARVLVAGGMLPGDTSTGRSYRLDLRTGRALAGAPLVVPVHDAAGGGYAGAPAVFGGGNATEQSLVQQLHHGRWRRVDALPGTRSDLSVAEVGATTFVLGGYDGSSVPREVLRQRGGSRLTPAGRLRVGVRYAATAVVGSHVYLFGGEVAGRELGVVQRFDAGTGRTSVVARLPHPLGHAAAAVTGGRVLLLGGHSSPAVRTGRIWWFDPSTDRFHPAGRLPRPLSDAAVAVAGGAVYLLGGEDPGVTDRVVRVDPGGPAAGARHSD